MHAVYMTNYFCQLVSIHDLFQISVEKVLCSESVLTPLRKDEFPFPENVQMIEANCFYYK